MRISAAIAMAFICHLRTANAFVRPSLQINTRASSAFDVSRTNQRPINWIHIASASSYRINYSQKLASSNLFSSLNAETYIDIDPYSEEAKQNLAKLYSSLDDEQSNLIHTDVEKAHKSLLKLTEQVLSWNQRLNLVSRKDCNASVVYHRHVLPSVALLPLLVPLLNGQENNRLNIVDVGTGGGFPGLPLALLLPQFQFTLVDSVQKKLVAVSEMASELDISNVRIHCGRVEEMYAGEGRKSHYKSYDVVLGRSVTALPRFCAWVSTLLKEDGKLIYIIGGELEEIVETHIQSDTPVDSLLQREEATSDKRALIFSAASVRQIGQKSGENMSVVRNSGQSKTKSTAARKSQGKKLAKGEWSKKRNDVKKDRGYDDFKRYEF